MAVCGLNDPIIDPQSLEAGMLCDNTNNGCQDWLSCAHEIFARESEDICPAGVVCHGNQNQSKFKTVKGNDKTVLNFIHLTGSLKLSPLIFNQKNCLSFWDCSKVKVP